MFSSMREKLCSKWTKPDETKKGPKFFGAIFPIKLSFNFLDMGADSFNVGIKLFEP